MNFEPEQTRTGFHSTNPNQTTTAVSTINKAAKKTVDDVNLTDLVRNPANNNTIKMRVTAN